jgi:hypothetical protein
VVAHACLSRRAELLDALLADFDFWARAFEAGARR